MEEGDDLGRMSIEGMSRDGLSVHVFGKGLSHITLYYVFSHYIDSSECHSKRSSACFDHDQRARDREDYYVAQLTVRVCTLLRQQ